MVPSYLFALEASARLQSRHQRAAACLASQAHRILGIVALHRDPLKVRERHCKQALYYATVGSDMNSQASALISLASTYFHGSDPARAAALYEQALGFGSDMHALQRSRFHAELAVAYGQLRREQESIRSAGLAEEIYPDHPEEDRAFLYAEFTPAPLALERGLAYVALAEQYPGRGTAAARTRDGAAARDGRRRAGHRRRGARRHAPPARGQVTAAPVNCAHCGTPLPAGSRGTWSTATTTAVRWPRTTGARAEPRRRRDGSTPRSARTTPRCGPRRPALSSSARPTAGTGQQSGWCLTAWRWS